MQYVWSQLLISWCFSTSQQEVKNAFLFFLGGDFMEQLLHFHMVTCVDLLCPHPLCAGVWPVLTSVGVAVGDGSDRRCRRRGDAAVRLSAAPPGAAARLDLHPHLRAARAPVHLHHRPRPLTEEQPRPPGHPPVLHQHHLFIVLLPLQLCEWQLSDRSSA